MPETTADAPGLLTEQDIYLLREGTHSRLYQVMGAHPAEEGGVEGARFAVWAPNARAVSVIGSFNGWQPGANPLTSRHDSSGIWEGFVLGAVHGECYKYRIESAYDGFVADRGDPFARFWEVPPDTSSRVWKAEYAWKDDAWMRERAQRNGLDRPLSVYEVHLGSWRRARENGGERFLSYREAAHALAEYVAATGFTHVELMPIMEHPFYGSWGYQTTGYFAPTARYGSPEDFMYLVDTLHRHGIGVILDWVPSHFPNDAHGLNYFDGTHLYEHADPREGFHPDWNSYIFNYGRHEVRAFLLSSALFWLDRYHVDGLRVDAVASMLYRDYARKEGEWIPNQYGGRENLEAMAFLRRLNEAIHRDYPDVLTIAEESTAWPKVSHPVAEGGLGFDLKWNMGWMNDTLRYMSLDPIHRKYHQGQLTFSIWYAFSERFMLSLSHDEVVYGKGSLIGKMPGDEWRKRANLRLLLGYMAGHPGKQLLFMGGEFGQTNEWAHEGSLQWDLLQVPEHQGLKAWTRDLNALYRSSPALFQRDSDPGGFEWMEFQDAENSIIAFVRRGQGPDDLMLVVCNFTPVPRENYRIGVPRAGWWEEMLNSDAWMYGGSGQGNFGGIESTPIAVREQYNSLPLTLPPLGVIFLAYREKRT
jgi:1,4-alpha-glucan branching enzyme